MSSLSSDGEFRPELFGVSSKPGGTGEAGEGEAGGDGGGLSNGVWGRVALSLISCVSFYVHGFVNSDVGYRLDWPLYVQSLISAVGDFYLDDPRRRLTLHPGMGQKGLPERAHSWG